MEILKTVRLQFLIQVVPGNEGSSYSDKYELKMRFVFALAQTSARIREGVVAIKN
jgi:hypothetical protein